MVFVVAMKITEAELRQLRDDGWDELPEAFVAVEIENVRWEDALLPSKSQLILMSKGYLRD